MTFKLTWNHLLSGVVVVAAIMPLVITYTAYRDDRYADAFLGSRTGVSPGATTFSWGLLFTLSVVYLLRVLIPFVIGRAISLNRAQGMWVGAVKASVFFEGLLLFCALTLTPPSDEDMFTGAGFGIVFMIAIVVVSCVAQCIGMAIGAQRGFQGKRTSA